MNDMRTPHRRISGLGAAKDGTGHFIAQRLTTLALIPLTFFLIVTAIRLVGAPYERVVEVLSSPFVAILLLTMVLTGLYHMHIGIQVILEDYVYDEVHKFLSVTASLFVSLIIAIACIWAVLKISFL
jgi:succinate dehydrogenase / fumarate reductase membrane anchor subunit